MQYQTAYPRSGQVALLCEGDLIGYEATLFQKWAGIFLGNRPLIDIWSCGTASAIVGISDAIGRSRPILVIEDRDFRRDVESVADCAKVRNNREGRGIRVLDWRSWKRNEVENYLLEQEVLSPVLCTAFGCSEQDILEALAEILPSLALFQAAQYAAGRARRAWSATDPAPLLLSGLHSRPEWDDQSRRILPPDDSAFRTAFEERLVHWIELPRPDVTDLRSDFQSKYDEWKAVGCENTVWRWDWAGKEVLQWLRIALTSRFGWLIDRDSGKRETIKWQMNRQQREAQDRPIEAALRPRLIDRFLRCLPTLSNEIRNEFDEIRTKLETWRD